MANPGDPAEFRSLSGQAETAEPAGGSNSNVGSTTASSKRPAGTQSTTQIPQLAQSASSSSAAVPKLRKSSSTNLAPLTSTAGQSPQTSRNSSPARKDKPPSLSASISTQPSAAAMQRALSASSVQQLQYQQPFSPNPPDAPARKPREQKSANASAQNTAQWPTSPRLKSPPPSASSSRRVSTAQQKKAEPTAAAPSISLQNATPRDNTPSEAPAKENKPDPNLQLPPSSSTKAPSRGPSGKSVLETVQENTDSVAEPSAAAIQAAADLKPLTKLTAEPGRAANGADAEKHTQLGESGSESAGNKSDGSRSRRASVSQTPKPPKLKATASKANYPHSAKRHSEGKQGMTVETETVPSIPQSSLNAGDRGGRVESGSVRLKPSNETIRPKKERRKNDRKTRSVNQGTATSKADLFEARVASAVDEANTSDSDETFVYESNPPEPQRRQRHHSRTPSVTSAHSTTEQQRSGIRSFGDAFDDRRIGGKRSMKFSSNPYNEVDNADNNGTVRSHTPRHIGRYGRGGPHSATFDPDSPFTQAQKGRTHHLSAHTRSRPTSPRTPQSMQYRANGLFGKKAEHAYDFDAEQNADDEQTPLLGSIRGPRGFRNVRRPNSISVHSSVDHGRQHERARWCGARTCGCLILTLVILAVLCCAIGFGFASNRPLQDMKIHKIQNVLASEQELMFDLLVGAVNPNTLGITVSDMNISVFAKSKHDTPSDDAELHVRKMRRRDRPAVSDYNPNPSQDLSGHWRAPDPGHDHGTDPDDTEREAQTMLIGRVFHFDQALNFEASPIQNHEHVSSGQVRLYKPGNATETGGSKRWERVIQYPFELIVRGVLSYQLPISARTQNAAVGASVMVHPEEGIDKWGNMRTEPVDDSEFWQWIDWPDELEDEG